jgi:hypothetical protein
MRLTDVFEKTFIGSRSILIASTAYLRHNVLVICFNVLCQHIVSNISILRYLHNLTKAFVSAIIITKIMAKFVSIIQE